MKTKAKIPLLHYWTRRYFITLLVGLVMIGLISAIWIQHTTLNNRLNMTKLFAEELADRINIENGKISDDHRYSRIIDARQKLIRTEKPYKIYIKNDKGEIIFPKLYKNESITSYVEELKIAKTNNMVQLNVPNLGSTFFVTSPILLNDKLQGSVVMVQTKKSLSHVEIEYHILAIFLISLAILGWYVIYRLSRKLAIPIEQVAKASNELKKGNYDISLENQDIQEKEIYDLIDSFGEMASRLKKLESLRTELLAGVTHELKTPIASISALLQAVRDDIVENEEKDEFINISIHETKRLERMVKDLLDFNSFSAGAIKLHLEKVNINQFLKEATYQWQLINLKDTEINLELKIQDNDLFAEVDPVRVKQILDNLLNNSMNALNDHGSILVELYEVEQYIYIDVIDNGVGVLEYDRDYIFERFYRGENMKRHTRGLGLGLPFSRMLARAQKGDLSLDNKSKNTKFTLKLPKLER